MVVVDEACVSRLDLPVALDEDAVEAVDHYLGDGVVGQEPLERAVAEDVGRDLLDQALTINRSERRPGGVELARDGFQYFPLQVGRLLVGEEP